MKFYYDVMAQFAKANAPSFKEEGYWELIEAAWKHFNTRSVVAANPKEITNIEMIDDYTLKISFWSTNELDLQQATRSLRVFSMYLIDEKHEVNFANLISGKRLFKMQASIGLYTKKEQELEARKLLDKLEAMGKEPGSIANDILEQKLGTEVVDKLFELFNKLTDLLEQIGDTESASIIKNQQELIMMKNAFIFTMNKNF